MSTILPKWIDQVPGVDFTPEKSLLQDLEQQAREDGWLVSGGEELPSDQRNRTDILVTDAERERRLRIAVLRKARRAAGGMRIDASADNPFTYRAFDLVYQPREKRWQLETGTVVLSKDFREEGWEQLKRYAFDL